MKNLKKIDNLRAETIFKERFADPSSFTFVFVGSIDMSTAKPLIEKYLGALTKKDNKENCKDLNIHFPKDNKNVTAYKGTDSKSMVYTILTGETEPTLENKIAISALSYILTDSLIDQIREKKRWTYSISAQPQIRAIQNKEFGIFVFFSCAPDKVDSINIEIMQNANKLKKIEISDQELHNTKEKLKRGHETDLRTNKYWLNSLIFISQTGYDATFYTDYNKIVNNLTKKSIKKYANKFISGKYTSIALKPKR